MSADLSDLFLPPLFMPASDKPADECLQVIPDQTSKVLLFFSVRDIPANVSFPPLRLFETLKLVFPKPLVPQVEHFWHCRGEKSNRRPLKVFGWSLCSVRRYKDSLPVNVIGNDDNFPCGFPTATFDFPGSDSDLARK